MRRAAYRLFWFLHPHAIRLSGGRFGWRVRGQDVLELEHVGRRSGALRRNFLYYQRDGENLLVVASNIGDARNPEWLKNLLVHAETHVSRAGDRRAVHARVATAEERARLWPQLTARNPAYADYARLTEREIPIVILEPPGATRQRMRPDESLLHRIKR